MEEAQEFAGGLGQGAPMAQNLGTRHLQGMGSPHLNGEGSSQEVYGRHLVQPRQRPG